MKKLFTAFAAACLMVPAIGQSDWIRPKAVGLSFFYNDFLTAERIRSTSLNKVLSDHNWAKFREMNPGLAIHYFQGITNHIDFAGTIGGSSIKYPFPGKTIPTENFLLEANASLNFKLTTDRYCVQPFLIAGVGGHKYKNYYGAFMPLGIGLKVRLHKEVNMFANSTYRVAVTTETSNYHFQHSIGIAAAFEKRKQKVIPPPPPPPLDTDKDGIVDSVDKCPTVAGLAKYDGCPIPDSDKDGINDEDDKCPTVPGLARYQGCPVPDSDKDGINDDDDKCPTVSGVARYQGCPVPDTDNDGVNDEEDKCPTLAGPVENQGCPVVSTEVKKRVDHAANYILFITGSFKLLPSSNKGLDDVVRIMKEDPDLVVSIDGHTDNVGTDEFNQKLSENRAAAVKNYFIGKGVDESRITSAGHGETMPLADNATAEGRKKNRRVEMKLTYIK